MLRFASPLVVAAYGKGRLTPRVSRALPAAFLQSGPKLKAFATFYESVRMGLTNFGGLSMIQSI